MISLFNIDIKFLVAMGHASTASFKADNVYSTLTIPNFRSYSLSSSQFHRICIKLLSPGTIPIIVISAYLHHLHDYVILRILNKENRHDCIVAAYQTL